MKQMQELHFQSELKLTVGQKSSAGIKPQNEDAIGIRIPEKSLLSTKGVVAVIADGVSTAEAGKEASETSVYNFLSDYFSTPESWSVKKSAQQVLTALNRWLYGSGHRFSNSQKGYVCTLSILIIKSTTAHIFHVGDSRIYCLRKGELELLTRDHATVISEQQSYLTRAMGLDTKLDVDYNKVEIEKGDVFLLSTDGLHDYVVDRDMARIIENSDDLESTCDVLIYAALANNSEDNISCQLLRVDDLPAQEIEDIYTSLTDLPFPPFLDVGMILDGYKIIREIHASSRSQLYLVENTETKKRYCMKTPSINFEDDPAYIERFIMESWIGTRINSSHVVKIVERQRHKSCLYYLMEYIDGLSLSQWIRENPKPAVQETVYIIDQISRGIRALHRKEILHQDIKPDNIMIDKNGIVKVIDLGSCFTAGIAEIAAPLVRDIALGTMSYSAPEYTVKKQAGPQADIFSLAVLSYEMFTGELPFSGKLENCKTPADFLKTKYIASYQINPLVPVWIDGAIRRGLHYNPQNRYQEVSEFVYDLQNPNAKYFDREYVPLIDKNPLLVWQGLLAIFFTAFIVMLFLYSVK